MFEIEKVRDRERKIGFSLHKGTEILVRHRERFEIESVRDRESQLYIYPRRLDIVEERDKMSIYGISSIRYYLGNTTKTFHVLFISFDIRRPL